MDFLDVKYIESLHLPIVIFQDHKTCGNTPNSYLLFVLRRSLNRISLDTSENWDVPLPIPGLHMVIAIDFHWAKQIIFYTDVQRHILRYTQITRTEV